MAALSAGDRLLCYSDFVREVGGNRETFNGVTKADLKAAVNALDDFLGAQGVYVVLECEHLCMVARGIKAHGSTTITSAVRGTFKADPAARAEFLTLIGKSRGMA
jgi:hypothetical protein